MPRSARQQQIRQPNSDLIRLPQLVADSGLTTGTIRGMVNRGELSPIKIGKGIYFSRAQVRDRLADYTRAA